MRISSWSNERMLPSGTTNSPSRTQRGASRAIIASTISGKYRSSGWPDFERSATRERTPPCILVVIDEHMIGRSLRDPIFRGDERRIALREHQRQLLGKRPHLLLRRSADDRYIDMDASRSRGLDKRRHAERRQRFA